MLLERILKGEVVNFPMKNNEQETVIKTTGNVIEQLSIELDTYNENNAETTLPLNFIDENVRFEAEADKLVVNAK